MIAYSEVSAHVLQAAMSLLEMNCVCLELQLLFCLFALSTRNPVSPAENAISYIYVACECLLIVHLKVSSKEYNYLETGFMKAGLGTPSPKRTKNYREQSFFKSTFQV